MKSVLINGLLLNNSYAGVQYSIEYLLQALSESCNDDVNFNVLVSNDYKGLLKQNLNFSLTRVSFNSSNRGQRIFFENFGLPRFFKKNRFDLYHSPGYTLPYFANIPSVVTIHDLIALEFPKLCQNETALYFSAVLPNAIRSAKKIIAVSNTVKRDILNRFREIEDNKIEVVYHGLHERFVRVRNPAKLLLVKAQYNLPDKYLFFVGNLEPKKNLTFVIEAFLEAKKQLGLEHKLVIAGRKAWKYSSIFKLLNESEFRDEIVFTGYVDEEDLPSLYSMAEMLLFPSLYEGFGLPVIEAMACGCPVVVSNRGALPEISGGICPIIDPLAIGELVSCIVSIITNSDYRSGLVSKGYAHCRYFSWENSAQKTSMIYKTLVY